MFSTRCLALAVVSALAVSSSYGAAIHRRDDIPFVYDAKGYYPSPHGGWASDWLESYAKAQALVEQMSLVEKINITGGTGFYMGEMVLSLIFLLHQGDFLPV